MHNYMAADVVDNWSTTESLKSLTLNDDAILDADPWGRSEEEEGKWDHLMYIQQGPSDVG